MIPSGGGELDFPRCFFSEVRNILIGLEKLDYISRRIEAKHLFATPTIYNIILELHPVLFKSGNNRFDIIDINDESIPSSW